MFNKGEIWSGFIAWVQQMIAGALGAVPTVVEIGYGDGSFLTNLADVCGAGAFIGFDPHGAASGDSRLNLQRCLFNPHRHIEELQPDIIISRHVLEHLVNPLGFLQSIGLASTLSGCEPLIYLEVPCIDRVLETNRTVDLYYEHSSQFTTGSFKRMLDRAGMQAINVGHGYDGEVIYALSRIGVSPHFSQHVREANRYRSFTRAGRWTIVQQLDAMAEAGRPVAIWGGTGKAAAFIQRYGADADRFPIVVDSDPEKIGTYVPGAGQLIRPVNWLIDHPVEVIIIPPQWRAADIMAEMGRVGVRACQVLIEHEGRLIDFEAEPHPYRGIAPAEANPS